jgi:hypothetical protein
MAGRSHWPTSIRRPILSTLMDAAAHPPSSDRFEGLKLEGRPLATSEVRWFAPGPPPAPVVAWFSERGRAAFVELRRDAYRIGPDHGVGLKRRDHGPLELKRRHGISPRRAFVAGLAGRIEEWRKDGLEEPLDATGWQWSLVDKVVLTRTFAREESGSVVEIGHVAQQPSGCDVELATVTVGSTVAWTFALEAWGELEERRELLHSSLAAVFELLPSVPSQFVPSLESDMGYPEWLTSKVWHEDLIASS